MANEIWRNPNEYLRHYFHLGKGNLITYELAFFALRRKLKFYEAIQTGEYTFQEKVEKWLGIPMKKGVSAQEALLCFCERHVGYKLDDSEVIRFRSLVVNASKEGGFSEPQPKRVNNLGAEALNNRLKNINFPYIVEKETWTINAIEEDLHERRKEEY